MNNQPIGRIIVVLGMHRSGTSALTWGLKTLGIQLGENLKDESAFDNLKGFWEDIDILKKNEDILKTCGLSWHSFTEIDPFFWETLTAANFKMEAIELIRAKINKYPIWGFKEPRTCRLLSFWKDVFQHVNVQEDYVIVLRNPKSVADSLAARNKFKPEKSYLLWLIHIISVLNDLENKPKIIIDYDRLIKDPLSQLIRISKFLDLPLVENENNKILETYTKDFLDNSLCHANWQREDIEIDPKIYSSIRRIYPLLDAAAQDQLSLESPELLDAVHDIHSTLREFNSFFSYVDDLDISNESNASKLKDNASKLKDNASKLKDTLLLYDQAIKERDATVVQLHDTSVKYAQVCEQVKQLKINLNDLQLCLNDIKLKNKILSDSFVSILSSKSWRWTKPIRSFYNGIEWMSWRFRDVQGAYRKGGIPCVFKKTIEYIQNLFTWKSNNRP